MIKAQVGDIVKVDLDAKLDSGTVVVTTKRTKPITFQLGAGEVIPGLERAVIGMTPGESKTTKVPPEDAFGRYSGRRLIPIDRDAFPSHIDPYKGQILRLKRVDGRTGLIRVARVDNSRVMLDTNHILAGREITLDVELLAVLPPAGQPPMVAGIAGPGMSRPNEAEIL
jgi:peptidylprolyl isomerase